jgi:hypothetical protein
MAAQSDTRPLDVTVAADPSAPLKSHQTSRECSGLECAVGFVADLGDLRVAVCHSGALRGLRPRSTHRRHSVLPSSAATAGWPVAAALLMLKLMRWFLGRSRMVQRRCLACGETWTIEASEAHMHTGRSGHLSGLVAGRGGSMGPGAGQIVSRQFAEASDGLDQEAETIRQLRTCPKCGGDHYKDRRARTGTA